jgi:phage shock protein PspC (stress-responsive transcriptional regulator)
MERMTEDNGTEPRRLTRSDEGRLLTGVCAGLARYTRIDAVVFRVGFALLVITTGIGILLYIAAFLLMAPADGGPSKIERMSKRIMDGDTVLALIGGVLGAGMLLGVIGHWGSGDALAVVVVFGLAVLTARSRGVDLVQVLRGMPDRLRGRPLASWAPPAPAAPGRRMSEGMIDLARLGRRTATPTHPYPPSADAPTPPYPSSAEAPSPGLGPYGTDPYVQEAYATNPATAVPEPAPWAMPARPPRRRRSWLSAITLAAAVLTGAILYFPVTGDRPFLHGMQIVLAGALAVVALGLLLSAWFGRDRNLITVGVIMSLALAATSIAGNAAIARKTHQTRWRPTAVMQADQSHKVFIGEGLVDLTTLPLGPGERIQVNAEVTLGVLAVKVPSTARVEVDGHAILGDITVDRQVTSGPSARVRRVLEPEGTTGGTAPTIALRIRSKVGDMEVTRVPA